MEVENQEDIASQEHKVPWKTILLFVQSMSLTIGLGNVWRFPRMVVSEASDQGGGTFIMQWIILLFLWTIPLILAESRIGKETMKNIISATIDIRGEKSLWIGCFIHGVTLLIGFYYVVITGWSVFYFFSCLFFPLPTTIEESIFIWDDLHGSAVPAFMSVVTLVIAALIAHMQWDDRIGVVAMPIFILMALIGWLTSFFFYGGLSGLQFMFKPDWKMFLQGDKWMTALSQNAWDTGAGYGLYLFLSRKETFHRIRTGIIPPIINNIVSLMISMILFSFAFSTMRNVGQSEILQQMKESGYATSGYSFIWITLSLSHLGPYFGRVLAILFFTVLSCCSVSCLASIMNISVQTLRNMWETDRPIVAMIVVTVPMILISILPSLNLSFLLNQDYVWGRGLVLSGLLIFVIILYSTPRPSWEWRLKPMFAYVKRYFCLAFGGTIVVWWLIQSMAARGNPQWYHPFVVKSMITCLFQYVLLAIVSVVATVIYCSREKCTCMDVYNKLDEEKEAIELEEIK